MTVYYGCKLKDTIVIDKLYSVHYFEYSKAYKFLGEAHNFWELVYVDKGKITAIADNTRLTLEQGDIIFHKPNEWHELHADGTVAPNIAVISFGTASEAMYYFENKILKINQNQKLIISKILSEYTNAFSTPLNIPETNKLTLRDDSFVGSQQLIKQFICELLISLMRSEANSAVQATRLKQNQSNSLVNLLVNFMESNIDKTLHIEDLVKYSGSNKTTITNAFREACGTSALEYFINIKIDRAKLYLREETYNITQIAEILGYSSIHYFSRQFKKATGMSPTEYSISIKAMNFPE